MNSRCFPSYIKMQWFTHPPITLLACLISCRSVSLQLYNYRASRFLRQCKETNGKRTWTMPNKTKVSNAPELKRSKASPILRQCAWLECAHACVPVTPNGMNWAILRDCRDLEPQHGDTVLISSVSENDIVRQSVHLLSSWTVSIVTSRDLLHCCALHTG